MAKQYNIKWNRSDIGKLSSAVSRFNKTIKKLESAESDLVLPISERFHFILYCFAIF